VSGLPEFGPHLREAGMFRRIGSNDLGGVAVPAVRLGTWRFLI
jgi:hypothetical protein